MGSTIVASRECKTKFDKYEKTTEMLSSYNMAKGQQRRKFLTSSSSSSSSSSEDQAIAPPTPKPRILYTPNGDQVLELTIESLMGTTFEVRLPAKTLVASIKNRFQRSEGVPRHHLHIIHGG